MKKDGRKLRSESTTDHILNTAIRIARKGNIDDMSFNSIAKEAKIGTRTIFRHFKDQETLQENLDIKLGEDFSSAFAKINIEDNLEKRIENLSTILIKLYSKNQNIIRWSLRNIWRDKNLRKNMFSWNKILRNFVFSILPERYDCLPAITAFLNASAISKGFFAFAIAVLTSTPSHPSSIEIVASDA